MVVMVCKQHTEDGGDHDSARGKGAAEPLCTMMDRWTPRKLVQHV